MWLRKVEGCVQQTSLLKREEARASKQQSIIVFIVAKTTTFPLIVVFLSFNGMSINFIAFLVWYHSPGAGASIFYPVFGEINGIVHGFWPKCDLPAPRRANLKRNQYHLTTATATTATPTVVKSYHCCHHYDDYVTAVILVYLFTFSLSLSFSCDLSPKGNYQNGACRLLTPFCQ